jgi:hypothetical protein
MDVGALIILGTFPRIDRRKMMVMNMDLRRELLETVLCNPLLGSCSSWTTTMETGVFSKLPVPRGNLEDIWVTQSVDS